MKSQAMRKAWELFKKYQITFSEALIEGWKYVKRLWLKSEFAKTFPSEITYRNKLVSRYNLLAPKLFLPRNHTSETIVVNLNLNERYEAWMQ
jgi:hypothetical protein